jgi:hypothetical protein
VTPYNNPALQLFLQATLEPYRLQWQAGKEKMLLVSVGTGLTPATDARLKANELGFFRIARGVLGTMFNSAIYQQDLVCRALGNCLAGDSLDREVGDLIGAKGPAQPKLYTYVRYNATLTRKRLDDLGLEDVEPEEVEKLDSVQHMKDLRRVGERVAKDKVKANTLSVSRLHTADCVSAEWESRHSPRPRDRRSRREISGAYSARWPRRERATLVASFQFVRQARPRCQVQLHPQRREHHEP